MLSQDVLSNDINGNRHNDLNEIILLHCTKVYINGNPTPTLEIYKPQIGLDKIYFVSQCNRYYLLL